MSTRDVYRRKNYVYGTEYMSHRTVFRWCSAFSAKHYWSNLVRSVWNVQALTSHAAITMCLIRSLWTTISRKNLFQAGVKTCSTANPGAWLPLEHLFQLPSQIGLSYMSRIYYFLFCILTNTYVLNKCF